MSDFFFRMKEKDPTIIRKEQTPPPKKKSLFNFLLYLL